MTKHRTHSCIDAQETRHPRQRGYGALPRTNYLTQIPNNAKVAEPPEIRTVKCSGLTATTGGQEMFTAVGGHMTPWNEFKFPMFTLEYCHACPIRTKTASMQKGCWEAVDLGCLRAGISHERKANSKALTFLFLAFEYSYPSDIGACISTRKMCVTLEDIRTKYELLHVPQLPQDFVNVQKQHNTFMKRCTNRLMDLH